MPDVDETYEGGTVRERWDGNAGTYTAFDAAGALLSSRPLTGQERAALSAAHPVPVEQRVAAVETSVADLDALIVAVLS